LLSPPTCRCCTLRPGTSIRLGTLRGAIHGEARGEYSAIPAATVPAVDRGC
jgi:hypothetical protein